ncbi:hypothetical protein [Ascidiimonas sp. W6]|uniref:hypothetical protein n=1 Tax=Ascidiimonas meishanensis TaxID=3128903 RepID=UPI0030EFA351
MRKLILLVLVFFISCQQKERKTSGLLGYVPKEAFSIVQINDLTSFKNNLRNNDFLAQFINTPIYSDFNDFISRLNYIETNKEILLCFNEVGKDNFEYTLISEKTEGFFKKDSLQDVVSERYKYENRSLDEITLKGQTSYHTELEGVTIISSSKLVIENIIRQKQSSTFEPDTSLKKIFASANENSAASIFIDSKRSNSFLKYLFPQKDFINDASLSSWIGVDTNIEQQSIRLNGIAISQDSLGSIISVFENSKAAENSLAKITPLNAKGVLSFSYSNWEDLSKELKTYNKDKVVSKTIPQIMPFSDETGIIYTNEGEVAALHFTNTEGAKIELEPYSSIGDTHRSISIYKLETYAFLVNELSPLIKNIAANFYAVLDDFIVFAENLPQLHVVIDNYQNKSTLYNSLAFKELMQGLNDQSSILAIGINPEIQNMLIKNGNPKVSKSLKKVPLTNYPLFAFQFVSDKGFLHTNGAIYQFKQKKNAGTVSQLFTVTLEEDVLNSPQFIINHRTDKKDIVIQDKKHQLYLISNEGKIRWKKKINDPIIGKIQQVDLYRNGRLQLAFNTNKELHVIDLKGNDVSPFPIAINSTITQPLSVFDYDKNRNYRFLVSAEQEVFMFDNAGEPVEGFTFRKSKKPIKNNPSHFRVSGKDYIVIPQTDYLSILDRRGKTRVKIKGELKLSGNQVYLYKNLITTTDTSGNLVQIDFKGNINRIGLGLQDNHKIDATSKTFVSLSDNILTIKGKQVELDFGIYTAPQLFYVKNKIYISVTDLQVNKTYLFDSQGKSISNFPVYGNSPIDLASVKNDQKIAIVTKGEANTILVYELN